MKYLPCEFRQQLGAPVARASSVKTSNIGTLDALTGSVKQPFMQSAAKSDSEPLLQSFCFAANVGFEQINELSMRIAFLHTADVHVATFDQIFEDIGADTRLDHRVDASLLDRARRDGTGSVRSDVSSLLEDLSDADAVLCTCSTLGPLADEAAKSAKNIIRIDRPLMEQACSDGSKVLVALCLESTRDATLDLLNDCALQAEKDIEPVVVVCSDAWAFFEAGDNDGYAASISEAIKSKLAEVSDVDSIVLAQASMRVAEARLADTGVPVHSSPVLAAKRCVKVARTNKSADHD